MRRRFVWVLAAGALSISGIAARAAQAPAPGSQPAPQAQAAAEDENWKPESIKNLTVLPKDMSPDEVMKVMRAWNTALNVQCVFCHVGQVGKPLSTFDFASDDKPRKEVSRIMLRAVLDVNEKFKAIEDDTPQISCATCHKRSRHVEDDLPPAPAAPQH